MPVRRTIAGRLIVAAVELRTAVSCLRFQRPVTHVYNPLDYAWPGYETYLRGFGDSKKRVVFLGMNPGPFGMAQTGIPFGEVNVVREWMGIRTSIGRPEREHPRRPVSGFACVRSEVSGARLWGLFATRFGQPARFFRDHFVANYCPLAFLEASGRNRTPDKLPARESSPLHAACDAHLRQVVEILQPDWLIGVGEFAEKRAMKIFISGEVKIGKILHPSPASPAANRNWAACATAQLQALAVWS